jgi:hypothetical protein
MIKRDRDAVLRILEGALRSTFQVHCPCMNARYRRLHPLMAGPSQIRYLAKNQSHARQIARPIILPSITSYADCNRGALGRTFRNPSVFLTVCVRQIKLDVEPEATDAINEHKNVPLKEIGNLDI